MLSQQIRSNKENKEKSILIYHSINNDEYEFDFKCTVACSRDKCACAALNLEQHAVHMIYSESISLTQDRVVIYVFSDSALKKRGSAWQY